MTSAMSDSGLEPHTTTDQLLTPVWVAIADLHLPGVLLRWEPRGEGWWGLIAWELAVAPDCVWVPCEAIRRIYPIRASAPPGFHDAA